MMGGGGREGRRREGKGRDGGGEGKGEGKEGERREIILFIFSLFKNRSELRWTQLCNYSYISPYFTLFHPVSPCFILISRGQLTLYTSILG